MRAIHEYIFDDNQWLIKSLLENSDIVHVLYKYCLTTISNVDNIYLEFEISATSENL